MEIREETAEVRPAIGDLHRQAFASPAEAELVDRLRADGDAVISLVAMAADRVVGHLMLSRMSAPFRALGLAPVAVTETWRRRGVAARLIADGIERAKAGGWDAVVVLGDPVYYERFGFSAEQAEGFESPYAGPYLMLLPLADGPLPASGRLDYAPAFAALE